jgi:hypothetical protein
MNFSKSAGLLAAVFVITSAVLVEAQKSPKYTNVTSVIAITDANNVPFTISGDSYGTYTQGANSVTSQIQPIGDWELDLFSSNLRTANFVIGSAIPGSNPDPATRLAPASGSYPARFLTQCSNYTAVLPAMLPGNTYKCGLIVGFHTATADYTMRFYTKNAPATGSEDATVSCTSAAAGKCTAWRIQSLGVDPGQLRARLFKVVSSNKGSTYVDYGLYSFAFETSFTNP